MLKSFLNALPAMILMSVLSARAGIADNLGKNGELKIIDKESGFVTCSGGTSQPLFSKTCQTLTLYRVVQQAIKYEGICLDSNGTTFYLACDTFNFEYNRKIPLNQIDKR